MNGEWGTPRLITDTQTLKKQPGAVLGFYVNSTTGGTVVLHDSTAADNAISGTITPAIGFHRFPAALVNGLHVVVANTISVTFFTQ